MVMAECLRDESVDENLPEGVHKAPKVRPYLSVPAELFGKKEDWDPSDKEWGYVFGTYELWNTDQVRQYLGGCERRTVERLASARKIRSRRSAEVGGRRYYCSRSVAQYAASLHD